MYLYFLFSHFGLEQTLTSEFDPDLMLEYEERDRENHFRLFFNDVVPELETYGNLFSSITFIYLSYINTI